MAKVKYMGLAERLLQMMLPYSDEIGRIYEKGQERYDDVMLMLC